ncbi:hypothetical protein T439DRAFT_359454 [Meredithblackwellia eburnea MCA 4105]
MLASLNNKHNVRIRFTSTLASLQSFQGLTICPSRFSISLVKSGYARWGGTSSHLEDAIFALDANNLVPSRVTVYVPGAEALVDGKLRKLKPSLPYVLDPVMGDDERIDVISAVFLPQTSLIQLDLLPSTPSSTSTSSDKKYLLCTGSSLASPATPTSPVVTKPFGMLLELLQSPANPSAKAQPTHQPEPSQPIGDNLHLFSPQSERAASPAPSSVFASPST